MSITYVISKRWKFELESIGSHGLVLLEQEVSDPENTHFLVCLPATASEELHPSLIEKSRIFFGNTLYCRWGIVTTVYDNCAYRAQRIPVDFRCWEGQLDIIISDIQKLQTRLSFSNIINSIDKKLSSVLTSLPLESDIPENTSNID